MLMATVGNIHPQFLGAGVALSAAWGQLVLLPLTDEETVSWSNGGGGGLHCCQGKEQHREGRTLLGAQRELGLLLVGLREAWLLALVSSLKGKGSPAK